MTDFSIRGPLGLTKLSLFGDDLSRALLRQGKALLESDALAEEVSALAPLEAYFVVKELGLNDAAPVLFAASKEQFATMVDLDCWRGDTLAAIELDAWLSPLAACDRVDMVERLCDLDSELVVLFLQRSLRVYDVREEEPPDTENPQMNTPDGFFVVEEIPLAEREVSPLMVVDALYRRSIEDAFRLLTAVRWELPSFLEEQAYQFRCGRLSDLGFLSPEDAVRVFARPPPHPDRTRSRTQIPVGLPVPYIERAPGNALWEALHLLDDTALLTDVEHELMLLINNLVIAFATPVHDLRAVKAIAQRARDAISCALEAACAADSAPRAVVLQKSVSLWSMRSLFQQGVHQAASLRREALALALDPKVRKFLDVSAEDPQVELDRQFLLALIETQVALSGGTDPDRPMARRCFANADEITSAQERLIRISRRLLGTLREKPRLS